MNRYSIGLLLIFPTALGLGAIGMQRGVEAPIFKTLICVLLFLSLFGLLHVVQIQNRFKSIVGFTKIMLLMRLFVEVLIIYPLPQIAMNQLQLIAATSGAISVLGLLVVGLLRARFPNPETASFQKGEPTLSFCPSCGIKLQRRYNPNACPSCSAVFKVNWLDRLPFR